MILRPVSVSRRRDRRVAEGSEAAHGGGDVIYPYETATEAERRLNTIWCCVHHDVKYEPLTESIEKRIENIRSSKPAHEIERRLRALRPMRGAIPLAVVRAQVALTETREAWAEAHAAWSEVCAALAETHAVSGEAYAASGKAYAVWTRMNATWAETLAIWTEAIVAHRNELDALWLENCRDVEWGKDGMVFAKETEIH
mgnify:FL=1